MNMEKEKFFVIAIDEDTQVMKIVSPMSEEYEEAQIWYNRLLENPRGFINPKIAQTIYG